MLANSIITPKDNNDPGTIPGVVVLAFIFPFRFAPALPILSGGIERPGSHSAILNYNS